MPKEKQNVYHYSIDGVFIAKYDSMYDACMNIYGYNKGLFNSKSYHIILEDKGIFLPNKMSRKDIKLLILKDANPLLINKLEEVEIINLDGDSIATFKNIKIASILTKDSIGTILSSLNRKSDKSIPRNQLRYYYRYKR